MARSADSWLHFCNKNSCHGKTPNMDKRADQDRKVRLIVVVVGLLTLASAIALMAALNLDFPG
jgi:hypothetical protein